MNQTPMVSARSFLIAGMSAAVVGAAVVTPVSAPALRPVKITTEAVQLASIRSGLEGIVENLAHVGAGIDGIFTSLTATVTHVLSIPDGAQAAIKNSYDNAEGWSGYAADMATFSLGLIPGLWWGARGIPLAYNTAEPLLRAGVYSFADIVGLDPVQFARDISAGISTSSENAATYSKAWADSLVRVPTLPPYPVPPSALATADSAAALPAASTPDVAAPQAAAVTSGIENAIKNTYNAVEPWVAWGFQLAQWGLAFVPGLWWVAPGISLAYYSIEPLVQAGVYTLADVLGLDFAQIGPDIQQGIQQSVQNFVNYGLAWIQSLIPFPPLPPFPPRPGAAVAAAGSLRAAAAIGAVDAPAAATDVTAAKDEAPVADGAKQTEDADAPAPEGANPATESRAPALDETAAAPEAVAPESIDPDTKGSTPTAEETVPPTAESTAPVAETVTPAVTAPGAQSPAAGEPAQPSRGARLGHRTPAGKADAGTGDSAKAVRPGASSR